MNLRNRDHKTEENISRYLDKNFYPVFQEDTRITDTIRITSVEEQRKGIDIKYVTEEREFLVDEKVSSNYNKKLTKFALEISSIQNGVEIEGWLTSKLFINDFYLFGWIDVVDSLVDGILINQYKVIEESNITSLDVMIVEKSKIINYLESLGYGEEYLRKLNNDVRANKLKLESGNYIRKHDYDKHLVDFHFTFSNRKREKPFMINIRKSRIEKLAYYSYTVDSEHCIKRKG